MARSISTAPTIWKPLRDATWRATAAPIGPKPVHQDSNRHRNLRIIARVFCAAPALLLCRASGGPNGLRWTLVTDRKRLRRQVLRGGAALAALLASVLHVPAPLSARSQPAARAAARRPPVAAEHAAPVLPAAGLAAQRQLRHRRRRSIRRRATLTGSEVITWRNQGAIAAYSIRAAPLLERVPQHQLDLAEAAPASPATTRSTSAKPDDFGYTDVTTHHDRQRRRQRWRST